MSSFRCKDIFNPRRKRSEPAYHLRLFPRFPIATYASQTPVKMISSYDVSHTKDITSTRAYSRFISGGRNSRYIKKKDDTTRGCPEFNLLTRQFATSRVKYCTFRNWMNSTRHRNHILIHLAPKPFLIMTENETHLRET